MSRFVYSQRISRSSMSFKKGEALACASNDAVSGPMDRTEDAGLIVSERKAPTARLRGRSSVRVVCIEYCPKLADM